jgi:tetratricopeptide (TPR) repeat protein
MLDYQIYGLNPVGYHMTNLILHILSTLLLFWLFNHMTGAIWRSAFVAALFALHPLRVESVAWIAERKDVLSAFFWMLTLCLYVYYTEKPVIKRYLLVCLFFACGFMSKSIVVTLPVIMILLDYWPLKRFQLQKGNFILWQLREKMPFFVLSAVFSIITIYAHHAGMSIQKWNYTLETRIINAFVSFVIYLEKTFWPHNLSLGYPFLGQAPSWQVLGAVSLIIVISAAVIFTMKRLPYLFVGWFWYAITILPVIGIIPVGNNAMADRYLYLPSIGIFTMLVWGITSLIKSEETRKKILFPAGIAVIAILAVLTWQQCGYWKNSITLFSHAVQVTKDNFLAHTNLGIALFEKGKIEEAIEHYNKAIGLNPAYSYPYNSRGIIYRERGRYQLAIEDFNNAIRINPDFAEFYYNRGTAYYDLGQYQLAIKDCDEAIILKPSFDNAYMGRGAAYLNQGNNTLGCHDAQKACALGNCKLLASARDIGLCR